MYSFEVIILNYELEEDWHMIFADLFQAGTDTTSTFLETVMLYMVIYPDVQEKVWMEMKSVVAPERNQKVSMDDLDGMPYTQATLLECLRMGKVSVNLVPRKALKDFEYRGFVIKKVIIHQYFYCKRSSRQFFIL
jgi:cytochrome P450